MHIFALFLLKHSIFTSVIVLHLFLFVCFPANLSRWFWVLIFSSSVLTVPSRSVFSSQYLYSLFHHPGWKRHRLEHETGHVYVHYVLLFCQWTRDKYIFRYSTQRLCTSFWQFHLDRVSPGFIKEYTGQCDCLITPRSRKLVSFPVRAKPVLKENRLVWLRKKKVISW